MIKHSYKIIAHNNHSLDVLKEKYPKADLSKVLYVPHPNYVNYFKDNIDYKYKKKKDEMTLLLFGKIKPYKNIETVIKVANNFKDNNKIKFIICGECRSEEYKNKVLSMIKSKNVITDFRSIENNELESLYENVDISIQPYNTISAFNSGVAILSMSFETPVISSDYEMIRDLEDTEGVYIFKYEDEDTNVKRITNYVKEIYKHFEKDNDYLKKQGKKLKSIMIKDYSIEAAAKKLEKIYDKN